jgi:hypothetical protein
MNNNPNSYNKFYPGEDYQMNNMNSFMNNSFSFSPQMFSSPNVYNNPHQFGFDPYSKFTQYNNLHKDIINYSKEVCENVNALKGLKISVIKKLEEIIKETLSKYK